MISRRTSSVPKEEVVFPDCSTVIRGAPRWARHYISPVNLDPSPGRRAAYNSPSEGTMFRQSRQSRPEHPGVSDGN